MKTRDIFRPHFQPARMIYDAILAAADKRDGFMITSDNSCGTNGLSDFVEMKRAKRSPSPLPAVPCDISIPFRIVSQWEPANG